MFTYYYVASLYGNIFEGPKTMASSLVALFKSSSPATSNLTRSQHLQDLTALIHSSSASPLGLKQIHARLLRLRLAGDPLLLSHLITAASSALSPLYSLSLFRRHSPTPPPSPLFNALIRCLSLPLPRLALSHFRLMISLGLRPGPLSLPFALRSAALLPSLPSASSLHASALCSALDLDPFVRTTLADSYLKLSLPSLALQLLDETPHWHRTSNLLLLNVSIKACCRMGALDRARELFDSMPERSVSSWNCLIDGFIKNGDLEMAQKLFEEMPERNVVSWTTVVAGFGKGGDAGRALEMFDRMMEARVRPNAYTLCSALAACAKVGALEAGIRIHDYASKNGFRSDGVLGTALVDMYAKCGKIEVASRTFDAMTERDISAWTAMIMGWAVHGRWHDALRCFEDVKRSLINPDEGVFLAAMTSCLHSGKVERGIEIFESMRNEYKIEPTLKHYTNLVDLLGRAGRFDEALKVIDSMPMEADFVLWGALFNACQAHKNVPIAELAAKKYVKLKPKNSDGYIFLSNVYSGAGRWEDAERVRTQMRDCSVEKSPGWSLIEIEGRSHRFVAGDQSHPQAKEIYEKLEEMVCRARPLGYEPSTEWALHNIEEEDKEESLGAHSEKLALSLALLSTAKGEEIRIVKNLRVCGDCHYLMKLVSRVYGRVIVLRDLKRFHRFEDGECSCGDYW